MKMKFPVTKYILLIVALCSMVAAKATHLVGGSMSYEYVSRLANGYFQYRVTLKIYRDCAASDVEFDPEIVVGAYNATGSRTLASEFTFSLLNEVSVNPPRGADCPDQPQVCLREATYSRLISLPPSSFGYHLMFMRCCRNTQKNIIDEMGQTYYAFIPPTNIRNSSPFFTGVPAPYICANDTTTYFNGASDPDGDSLSYKLVHPWSGADADLPNPNPPDQLSLPFANVVYRAGHNVNFPFGSAGVASINVNNGLTTMMPPNTGRYALAIEVTEWRNGVALSSIRLDVQMIVITCAPNKSPVIAPTTGNYVKRVIAGETICFDIEATDFDLNRNNVPQNITMSAKGEVFGGTGWTGPVATFAKKTAQQRVTSQFCWTSSCAQARGASYNFVVEAIDDGCPPKSRNVTFNIFVDPFVGSNLLNGPLQVCSGDGASTYTTDFTNGHRYEWTVTGGQVEGPTDGSSIKVKWGSSGTGKIKVVEYNKGGCAAPAKELVVNILPKPSKNNITGTDTLCEFSTNSLYQATLNAGNTYRWFVDGGSIVANPQPNQVRINWGGIGDGIVKMVEINSAGCAGDTNYFYVHKTRSLLDTLFGSPTVCPNLRGVNYYVIPREGASYRWVVEGGTLRSGNNTPSIIVDWGDEGIGYVKVVETLKWGCKGDTVRYRVNKSHNLGGMTPVGDDSVCEFSTKVRYEVIYTIGSTYHWTVNGGAITGDANRNWIEVNWGATGNGYVEVFETSYDSVNNKPCIGTPSRLPVVINPLPVANEIKGQFELCQHSGQYTYTLGGFPGSTYRWAIDGDTSNIQGQGKNTILVEWKKAGSFVLSVQEMTKDSCTSFTVDSVVLVNPKPVTTPIIGDSIVCNPLFGNHDYTTTGFATSVFNWIIDGGTINSGTGTDKINVDWSGAQNNTLRVLEVSDKGCLGDTQTLKIFADSPVLKMRVVSVGFPKDDHMVIKWELINAPRFNSKYTVQRRIAGVPDSWVTVGSVDKDNLTYVERNLNTDKTAFEYRIVALDLCGREIYSDVHTNILLTGTQPDAYEVNLNWTRYKGWTDGVRTYELHRSVDFDPSFVMQRDRGSDTTDNYSDGFDNFTQRYRVKAYENNAGGDTTWSNEIFFNFEPVIWVPNAFTPNDDQLNTKFQIVYGSIKTFELEIFDRWGERMFQTNNIANNWDGTYKDAPCPDGVYIYKLRYTGADNIIKVLMGNITLLR